MKILKILVGAVVLLLGVMLLIALLLDSEWRVERSVDIDAPPSKVLAYISLLPNWPEWTVWNAETYPEMKMSYSGPNWGVGAQQSWNDGSMVGVLEVTAYDPARYMEYSLDMDNGEFVMQCRIEALPRLTGSTVNWNCRGDTGGSPVDKLMMVIFKPLIGKDFEGGLNRLAARFAKDSGQ